MKKPVWIVAVFLTLTAYTGWCLTRPLPVLTVSYVAPKYAQSEPEPNIVWSNYGSQAIGTSNYGVMATKGNQKPRPTASVAKVMVALAVLNKLPIKLGHSGVNIKISAADQALYEHGLASDQSGVKVKTGEVLTEYQALQGLLIASGNNLATTLAVRGFGSVNGYLNYANKYARQIGMTNTRLADASGFSPQTVSTPSDLVKLGLEALKNPVIAQIVKQQSAVLPVAGNITNYNTALSSLINGIKTGNTVEAGGVLLFSADYDDNTKIVAVIMGAPDLGTTLADAPTLIKTAKNNLEQDNLVNQNDIITYIRAPWGASADVVSADTLNLLTWRGTKLTPTAQLQSLKPPYSSQNIGTLTYKYRAKELTAHLTLARPLEKPSLWWRLTHPTKL